jgi:hypothetical protein
MAKRPGAPSRYKSLAESALFYVPIGDEGCWDWQGEISSTNGYGIAYYKGRGYRAHRAVYEVARGPIPDGLQLDHLCRNRACVRPSHLEPVTNWENTRRGIGPFAIKANQTQCQNGHPYDSERRRRGKCPARRCSICDATSRARSRPAEHAKRRAVRAQYGPILRPIREALTALFRAI